MLAGAIALLGAFTLYRLQSLGAQEDDLCRLLRESYRGHETDRQSPEEDRERRRKEAARHVEKVEELTETSVVEPIGNDDALVVSTIPDCVIFPRSQWLSGQECAHWGAPTTHDVDIHRGAVQYVLAVSCILLRVR